MLAIILLLFVLVSCLSVPPYAAKSSTSDNSEIIPLRAGGAGGGGGGSGGGGGGGGAGGSGTSHSRVSSRPSSFLGTIFQFILLPIVMLSSSIAFYIKLTKRSRKSKQLMKLMRRSDNAWKYSDISETVYDSYMAIQKAWTDRDLSTVSKYMSNELLAEFQTKIDWMKVRNERNVLIDIELLKALPVAVHDDPDNSRDYVWFYIKGRMVDYTVDENTMTKISGSTSATSFIEYWQYVRRDDSWVLNKILQKEESDLIPFTE